jgi:hypothetical protein
MCKLESAHSFYTKNPEIRSSIFEAVSLKDSDYQTIENSEIDF